MFYPKSPLQAYCSVICQTSHIREKNLLKKKKCRICKTLFTPSNSTQAYCSIKCSDTQRKRVRVVRGTTPRIKSPTVSQLKKKAWDIFSRYIRTRDCIETTGYPDQGRCFTCDIIYPFKKLQAGHFVDGRTKPVLFNEDIVRIQCSGCNLFKKGNKDSYFPKMVEIHGIDRVLEFLELRHSKDKTWSKEELEAVAEIYKEKLENLLEVVERSRKI